MIGSVQERVGRAGGQVPPAVPVAIGAAWVLAILAEATGQGRLLHHDALIESALPLWAGLALFLVAWQAMVAAMMLPSSLPMIRLFALPARNQPRPVAVQSAFLGGYALVWAVFGAIAFLGDAGLHHLVDTTPWLEAHSWMIASGTFALAGAFQFSSLKEKCLSECRHPGAFLLQHYRRGIQDAFRFGRKHGLFCLGCCWALMLVMFAAGVANLWWMAALGSVMYYEKVGRFGKRIGPAVGVALLGLAASVALSANLPVLGI